MPQSTKDSAGGKTHADKQTGQKAKAAAKPKKNGTGPTGNTQNGEKKTTP